MKNKIYGVCHIFLYCIYYGLNIDYENLSIILDVLFICFLWSTKSLAVGKAFKYNCAFTYIIVMFKIDIFLHAFVGSWVLWCAICFTFLDHIMIARKEVANLFFASLWICKPCWCCTAKIEVSLWSGTHLRSLECVDEVFESWLSIKTLHIYLFFCFIYLK